MSYFFFILVISVFSASVKAQNGRTECSADTRRTCRSNIEDVISGYGSAKRLELEDQCWRVRRNFDCMLRQTSMCLNQKEQENNRDIITKAWRFLESFCENFKNWWTKTCYRSDKLKRCEDKLGSKSGSTDYSSCRNYLRFRDCAMSTIEDDCDSDDQRLLGVYLMDKGKEKSWNCPRNFSSYSLEPFNQAFSASAREINYGEVMQGDSPAAYLECASHINTALEKCQDKLSVAENEVRNMKDEDEVKQKMCCALNSFENCLMEEMQKVCGDSLVNQAKKAVSTALKNNDYSCDKFDKTTCAGPISTSVTQALVIGGILTSLFMAAFI